MLAMTKQELEEKKAKRQAGNRTLFRTLVGKVLLVVCGLFCGLLVCEIILRVAGYTRPNFYLRDPIVGSALRPGAEGWWTKEGSAYVRINSAGLRDREHTKAKPANTVRIAVLGDSYAEALQVPIEKTFWAILEAKLRECKALPSQNVEVINFGVSGYGTAQELLTLRERVWNYSPDIVLLTMTTINDIGDDSRALKQTDDIPYFVFSDGRLVLDDSFRNSRMYRLRDPTLHNSLRWFRDRSRVVQGIYEAAYAISAWLQTRSNRRGSSIFAEPGVDYAIYQEPRDAVWSDAWRVTEALIVLMRDEVKEKHAKFFVVTLSGGLQVHPERNVRQEFITKHGINDVFYPDLRIRDLCERESIPVLVLAPGMQIYAEQNKVYLHGFGKNLGGGHWNELGHRLGGETIASWLCDRLTANREPGSCYARLGNGDQLGLLTALVKSSSVGR
jgi:hypothetical protein